MNDNIQGWNSAKRLPIVFCLDVSPSMGWKEGNNPTSIELLNEAVSNFIKELKKDVKTKSSAEIAFVTFSSNIEMNTEFESISSITIPKFTTVEKGGTKMAQAVLCSIEKIEKRRRQLEDNDTGYYAPFFILVTDGNPDKNDNLEKQELALSQVKSHCDSHVGASEIIVPFIIGVGDRINPETLNAYARGFTKGYFPIKGKKAYKFRKVFQMIGNSTKQSIHLNAEDKEIVHTIQNDMNDLYEDLIGK